MTRDASPRARDGASNATSRVPGRRRGRAFVRFFFCGESTDSLSAPETSRGGDTHRLCRRVQQEVASLQVSGERRRAPEYRDYSPADV
ncbi:uncharacterized protein MICPUCDRAFT_50658 [Micromonas pusilla CCMP1545]|uniref:Predicted protein n=1 Tax=Micromonas pusilla (strain CCMP1545) TaxID=564608 RepID=C1MIQ6_MICPC|nr:uncharacterized protein MICPUCDRAFT_50658 [Micromonas pusilla CCMP1545]EEH60960.1 predicted protein [Micromonas pusilla CCMP1545]|eukprot:XP_003055708.1 predicted protein [Micromonas pusilla CCMP1545]